MVLAPDAPDGEPVVPLAFGVHFFRWSICPVAYGPCGATPPAKLESPNVASTPSPNVVKIADAAESAIRFGRL